jgi:hypothetical protein
MFQSKHCATARRIRDEGNTQFGCGNKAFGGGTTRSSLMSSGDSETLGTDVAEGAN